MRNRVGYEIVRGLERATDPLLRPLRRFIPPLGGMDFTPVLLILLLTGVDRFLVPPFFGWLHSLVTPAAIL
jgi:YggT family protein